MLNPMAKCHGQAYIVAMKALFRGMWERLLAGALSMGAVIAIAAPGCAQTPPKASSTKPVSRLPSLPPAVVDNNLLIGGADIAARKVDTRMTVGVDVAGRGPFRFVVDSGADSSALGSSAARVLNLPATTQALLHGMTDSRIVDRVTAPELKVGDSTLHDLELPVLKDEDLGAQGLLGIDALVEQRLMLDFDKKLITIEDARRPAAYVDGEIVVVARRRRGQLILTQASANGHAVDAVIDTGSEITIGNLALRDKLFRHSPTSLVSGEVTGVTGVVVKMQLAHLDELTIGPIMLHDVDIAFADVPPFAAFGLDDHPAIFLGTDLMANFRRVSLDFRARKVRFQLKKCKPSGFVLGQTMNWTRMSWGDPGATCT